MSDKSKKSKKDLGTKPMVEEEVPLQATEDVLLEEPVRKKQAKADKPKDKKDDDEFIKVPKNEITWKTIDPIVKVSLVIFLLACAVVVGYTIVDKTLADHSEAPLQYGDTVKVDYVGSYYGYYDEPGAAIFDTSIKSIGENTAYAKSWEFNPSYESLEFDIGDGEYLQLFESALIGHRPGETVKVIIDPANGYGVLTDSDKVVNVSKTSGSVNLVQYMSLADYESFFNVSEAPSSHGYTTLKSPYGWDAKVILGSDSIVCVQYDVTVGTKYDMNDDVKVTVTSIDDVSGTSVIKFTYEFTVEDGHLLKAIVNGAAVYIYEESEDHTKFSYKTTDEKVGMYLFFTITILEKVTDE